MSIIPLRPRPTLIGQARVDALFEADARLWEAIQALEKVGELDDEAGSWATAAAKTAEGARRQAERARKAVRRG